MKFFQPGQPPGTKPMAMSKVVAKHYRDTVAYRDGYKKVPTKTGRVEKHVIYDPANPYTGNPLIPGSLNPICGKCQLHEGNDNPFFEPRGTYSPTVTIIVDAVTQKADQMNDMLVGGSMGTLRKTIKELESVTGISLKDIRWVPLTRCAGNMTTNFKSKGNWCRHHLIDDLQRHPPKLVMPIGTTALGALSHKSNAQEWGGRLLTYRGWPDDWLTNQQYVRGRPHPVEGQPSIIGHPLFGAPPEGVRVPMIPLQVPRMIYGTQNPDVIKTWLLQLANALKVARDGITPPNYIRPWYRITEDPNEIEAAMREIMKEPKRFLAYDTETTGLRPQADDAAIVFMMFRWAQNGKPRSIGFPWDFKESGVRRYIRRLSPMVLDALYQSRTIGHNLGFDMLYTNGVVPGAVLDWLADSMWADTQHMAYTFKQQRGSLGLEALAYDYAPGLAGYEEEMVLLIELDYEKLHPEAGKGGHYAACDRSVWDSHLKPYVMGDVEVAWEASQAIQKKLDNAKEYAFPLARPGHLGTFHTFNPPRRDWVYRNIMAPSSRVLTKLMGRGLYVDQGALKELFRTYPARIDDQVQNFRKSDDRIDFWCQEQANMDAKWKLDLENKGQLKTILFDEANGLGLPVTRLTKKGRVLFGETKEDWNKNGITRERLLEFAAVDKFTLNGMSVDHPQVRPLQAYRKLFKLWSAYITPMADYVTVPTVGGITEHKLVYGGKDQHLRPDGCVHANFNLTGTRGGRLSSSNPNLQQLPRDGDVKSIYVSRFGGRGCIYSADLSQIELRLLAAACGDKSMVDAYFKNIDLHSQTTSLIFNVPYEHFSKDYMEFLQKHKKEKQAKALDEQRQVGKTTNFLTGYGGGAFGLQTTLANKGIYKPIEECEDIINAFFDAYPSLRRHIQRYKQFILDNGVALSIFGRVRIFQEVFGGDEEAVSKCLRAGYNHLIQSTASDMMLLALITIEDLMRQAGLESLLVSTVHDSLMIDAVRTELPQVHEIVMAVLNDFEGVFKAFFGQDYDTSWMIVPFAGDAEVGLSYLNMRKVKSTEPDWDALLRAA